MNKIWINFLSSPNKSSADPKIIQKLKQIIPNIINEPIPEE